MQQVLQPDLELSDRQREVLDVVLDLMVEEGDAFSMATVARRASCSKETLYKWFGGREGLLAATVEWQASKVRTFSGDALALPEGAFRANLETFARDLLSVLSSDISLALNRLAIGAASREENRLGGLLLERGRRMIGIRAGALLEAGRSRGLIVYQDREEAFETLYGLIIKDIHVRLLLGERNPLDQDQITARANAAVAQFFRLFGTENEGSGLMNNSTEHSNTREGK